MRLTALAGLLVLTFSVVAQAAPPKRGRYKPEPKESGAKAAAAEKKATQKSDGVDAESADDAPETDAPAHAQPAPPPSAEPAPASDLGEPPPASPSDATEGTKLSPLNPGADEFPSAAPAPPPVDFDRLLGDIAALRSRVAALTTTLFKSKLRVIVETDDVDARIDSLAVTLDDGVVFSAPERFSAEDERVVYEHAVAPGQHVLGIDIERYDARKREYRTWQSSKFTVVVPDSRVVEAHFVLEDDSEMAVDFPDDEDGEYDVRVRLRARVSE